MWVLWHGALWHSWVRALLSLLLLSHVVLVCHGLVNAAHAVGWVHWGSLHARAWLLLWWEVLWSWLLRRSALALVIDPVLVGASWLWSVQACLKHVSTEVVRGMEWWVRYLNQVLALGLGDKWLQLWSGEGVDETGLGNDE